MSDFERVLDDCLDRMRRGDGISTCLSRYPNYAAQLEPLLRAAQRTALTYDFSPSPAAVHAARNRYDAARGARSAAKETRTRQRSARRFSWPRPVPAAAIASVAVLALTALLLVRPALTPPTQPPTPDTTTSPAAEQAGENGAAVPGEQPVEQPAKPGIEDTSLPALIPVEAQPDGNFIFYLSDEPNDIGDFESLIVTVSSIALKPSGDGPWLSLTPTHTAADLVQLQGDRALEMWRGDIPEGSYSNVFVHVDDVEGVLAATRESVAIKLPSNRLHLHLEFEVLADELTEFVFDITVRRTGPPGAQSRYLLLPRASESGIDRNIARVDSQYRPLEERAGQPDTQGSGTHGADQPPPADTRPEPVDSRPGPESPYIRD